ncbi:MAG TPA: helix-turn-helix domain-containing protein [Candidatus Paceibacterota bacterium]
MNEILQAIGLSPDEIIVYEYLLTSGARTAGDVSRHTNIKRGTAYNVLGDLTARGFARQMGGENGGGVNKENVMKFALEHPVKIKEIIEGERNKKEEALRAFDTALPTLTSRWNLVYHRPAVRSFEGVEGLKKIYESIVNDDASEVLVIRSPLDEGLLTRDYFEAYAKRRADRSIKTRIISNKDITPELKETDEKFERERRFWPDLDIPSEIDIWGNKVALISFKDAVIGTVIENASITETMKKLFEKVWQATSANSQDNAERL